MADEKSLAERQRDIAEKVNLLREQGKLGYTADGSKFGDGEEPKLQAQIHDLFMGYVKQRTKDLWEAKSIDRGKNRLPGDGKLTLDEMFAAAAESANLKDPNLKVEAKNPLVISDETRKLLDAGFAKGFSPETSESIKNKGKELQVMVDAAVKFDNLQKRVPDNDPTDRVINLSEAAQKDLEFIRTTFPKEAAELENAPKNLENSLKCRPNIDKSTYNVLLQFANRPENER